VNASEVVVVVVAIGATAAVVYLANPSTTTAAGMVHQKETVASAPMSSASAAAMPSAISLGSTALTDSSRDAPSEGRDEAHGAFAVKDALFMPPAGAGLVRIGSFNMLHVGERAEKDYGKLARIVRQFDLCGVLELENEQALRELTAALGSGFQYVISEREAGDPSRKGTFEFYGFVYRSSKVAPVDGPLGFFPDEDGVFSREPFFASFGSGRFDFTMTLLHAESPGNSANLTRELEHLPDVFDYVQTLDPNENDVLLAGDFNRPPSTASGRPTPAWRAFLSFPQVDCVIPDSALTSLSSNPTGFANHYDDICLVRDATREFTGASGSFDFVTAMFDGQNAPAKKLVSDHLPVWAEFRTDEPDDDGVSVSAPSGATRDTGRSGPTSSVH
jgi:hypothetical protein